MGWIEKNKPTPFDNVPIDGLFFLDGDVLASIFLKDWTKGQLLPLITFDSGLDFELWDTGNPERHVVHLFGEMDLILEQSRDSAFARANDIAEQVGYLAYKVGENQLVVLGHDREEAYLLTYDNTAGLMVNAERVKSKERPKQPGHVLMNDEIRKLLPPLYSGEKSGEHLNAKAVLKYFQVLMGWIWYVSEGSPVDEDGLIDTDKEKVDYLFFGVVAGFEVELGYFTLSELESIGAETGLPIERDLDYTPQTLQEISSYHRRLRGE